MHRYYEDILSLTDKPPLWWDENAVPRYCPFEPTKIAGFYAHQAALVLIACQSCGTEFKVVISMDSIEALQTGSWLAESVPNIWYGDPPNTRCCPSGPTMRSDTKKILEFWQHVDSSWVRVHELELECEAEGSYDETRSS